MTAAIAVESLVKSYGGRRVVDEVSLEVRAGEVVALLGPNGAGKTTTVEIIEGYRRGDAGRVTVLGAEPERAGREQRARIGVVLQGGGGVDPRLTPLEVLRLHAAFHAAPRDPAELIASVGLAGAAGTRFRRLSGGERQRLGVALALVGRPDVAILDEPTAGMDVEGRALMRDVLASLRAEGVAILVTSHDIADVERVANRIVIIARGRVVAAGTLDELQQASSPTLSVRLPVALADGERQELAAALGATVAAQPDGWLRVSGGPPTPELVHALTAWCAARGLLVLELRTGGGTLEQRYLALVGDRADAGP